MKRRTLISLLLLIPAPSIGVLFGMVLFPGHPLGTGVFMFSKIWLLLFPALWFFFMEGHRMPRSHTAPGGYRMGWISGLAISVFIIGGALLGRQWIDGDFFREMMAEVGLDKRATYLWGAAYWILINSVLEEYVWRWFVVRQFSKLFHPTGAVLASGLGFTIHHFIAMQVYFSPWIAALCTLFIFVGGVWWSWMFVRCKTIWPGWLSHALVDIAVFGVGYWLIFST
jgi:membrane protease YdiL (CAAX protease family)